MIYYKNGKYHISNTKVHYIDEDEGEIIKYVGQEGKEWWVEFAERWKDSFKLIEFIEIEIKDEWLERLDEVNQLNIPEGFSDILNDYVENDTFPKGYNNPLGQLKLIKESNISASYAVYLDYRLSEIELGLQEG